MEKLNSLATQTVASLVTDAAMEKLTGLELKYSLRGPHVKQTNPGVHFRVGKAVRGVAVDQVGSLIPQAGDQKAFLRVLPGVLSEAAVTQTLSALCEAALERKLPNPKAVLVDIASDATKNAVFYGGRARTQMPRPVGNALWGAAAGATAELVEAKLQKRPAKPLKRGMQTAAAKLIYGEVKALLESGTLL